MQVLVASSKGVLGGTRVKMHGKNRGLFDKKLPSVKKAALGHDDVVGVVGVVLNGADQFKACHFLKERPVEVDAVHFPEVTP